MKNLGNDTYEITHFCLFSGMGGLPLGMNRGHARVGRARTRMRCLGGVDNWPVAISNFNRMVGTQGTVLDLFDRRDYEAFHGKAPPKGWREATPADIRAAAGGECPDIVATSPPCKAFSGLLNPKMAATPKYLALNNLVLRGIQLTLAAFADDLPAFILIENVPRIMQRGRQLLDDVEGLLRYHGYAVNETTHDCGELGALSQKRPRFLLVARNVHKIRPFLYVPPKSPVKSIGEALSKLPLPEDPRAGSMHRLPRLQWQTWMRLALIEAGKDWRSLERHAVVDGNLRDVGLMQIQPSAGSYGVVDPHVPPGTDWHRDVMGVMQWDKAAGTVKGRAHVTTGAHSVADPRWPEGQFGSFGPYRVVDWNKPSATVTAQAAPGSGPYTVADPRPIVGKKPMFGNMYRLISWGDPCNAVTGAVRPAGGAASVADPRIEAYGLHSGKLQVQDWEGPARTVTGADRVGSGAQVVADPRGLEIGQYSSKMLVRPWDKPTGTITADTDIQAGAQCIADPRPTWNKEASGDWSNGGHYGVLDWQQASGAVVAKAKHDNGFFNVADPRPLPAPNDRPDPVPLIVSLDGTWHRPLTTFELAHLQGFPVYNADGQPMQIEGGSEQVMRELIGNAVPPPTAEAIARTIGETMLAEVLGETFRLDTLPIWVRQTAVAIAMPGYNEA